MLDKEELAAFSELAAAIRDMKGELRNRGSFASGGHSSVTFSLGGWGVVIAGAACVVMLVLSFIQRSDMNTRLAEMKINMAGESRMIRDEMRQEMRELRIENRSENKTMQNYLNAIYARDPSLRPKKEK